jgi:MFS family permease
MTLEEFILGILAGSLSYPVARYLYAEFAPTDISRRTKRLGAYGVSFALALAALAGGHVFGYVEITPDTVFMAFATAFGTSQALHGWLELGPDSRQ